MSKGLASVAALAVSAGVAFGQGAPSAAPQGFPAWGNAVVGSTPGVPPGMSPPAGYSSGAPMYIPPAGPTEMPHQGLVGGGTTPYPGFNSTFGDQPPQGDGAPMGDAGQMGGPGCASPQVHKAAGGPDRFWIDVENIAWRVRSMPFPFPLAVGGSPIGGGILGAPGSVVLYGNDNVHYGDHFNVLRVSGGFWCNECCTWGLELSGFIQEPRSELANFVAPINGNNVLSRPIIDALTGQPSAVLVGFPGQFGGELFINTRLKMGGAEANVIHRLAYYDMFKLNFLAGVRYIDQVESLQITSRSVIPSGDPNDPNIVDIFDEFACRNQFLGANVGFEAELRCNRFFCDITGKIALGDQNESLHVSGFTNNRTAGIDTTTQGGVLALAGNSGEFGDNEFAYVPEVTVKLGYQWTQRLSTYIGYNGLYISRLQRPGDQIDPVINPSFLPVSQFFGANFGPVRPANTFNKADFWTQGVTFGVSIRY
jgi:hypothetical protein